MMNIEIENCSNELEESFVSTYSSLQLILSQMQMKLAAMFLQETEYLQTREEQLEQDEQVFQQCVKSLQQIQFEREELEKDFTLLQNRLESAIVHVINFHTNGSEILRLLFNESRLIDEEISGLISQCLSSLNRSRTMISSKIDQFSHQSNAIQTFLTECNQSIDQTQSSIKQFIDYIDQLNQINLEHCQEIDTANIGFTKRYQQIHDALEMNEIHVNLPEEMANIRVLEKTKQQLEKELLEQTILLENISTIIGKVID